jgi:CMP-N,N'-diacetyllegionaminic acid synthase
MNILITLCGRAGSKGVKNKNYRNFLGIPLVHYSIAAAKIFIENNPQHSVDICVNSDSKDLLAIATKFDGITGIIRPTDLAQDISPKVPVIKYSLNYMELQKNKQYDYVIDLDITSPLRRVEDISNALEKAHNMQVDAILSVTHARRNPYFNMLECKDGKLKKVISSNFTARQQAPTVYDVNASIYCYSRQGLLDKLKNSPLDGTFDIIIMTDTAVLDIDSEEDFILMEVLAKYFFENEYKNTYEYVLKLQNEL